jgi:hypothetical protein
MPWRPDGRRFRGLSLVILRPVHETSAIVHETSDIDRQVGRLLHFRSKTTVMQDSLTAAIV